MLLKDAYLSWGRFKHFELQLQANSIDEAQKTAYGKLLGKYMKQLICYSNYQTDYVLDYTYTIPDSDKINLFIRQFNESFIDNPNFKKVKDDEDTKNKNVYEYIIENIFQLKIYFKNKRYNIKLLW